MKRRDFITLIGGAAAMPLVARAQQPAMPVLGYLSSVRDELLGRQSAFLKGLSETGFVEGRSVAIEYRYAENQLDRLPALADELVRRPVNVLAAGGIPAAAAAKAATTTIPIAFFVAGDPVKLGLVTSMNRPDGNLTGVTSLGAELSAKRMELASELVPKGAGVALLVNPDNPIPRSSSRMRRQRPEVSGCSSTSCARLAQATSMPTSRPWPNSGPPRWWSETMDCS